MRGLLVLVVLAGCTDNFEHSSTAGRLCVDRGEVTFSTQNRGCPPPDFTAFCDVMHDGDTFVVHAYAAWNGEPASGCSRIVHNVSAVCAMPRSATEARWGSQTLVLDAGPRCISRGD